MSTADPSTWHIVTKGIHPEWSGAFTYRWECPGPQHCTGFSECSKPHIENGIDADKVTPYDGGDENPPPWDGLDEWTFHGILHTYHDGYGWTVPVDGCVLRYYRDWLEVDDALLDDPPGRYAIDISWDSPEEPYIDGVERLS